MLNEIDTPELEALHCGDKPLTPTPPTQDRIAIQILKNCQLHRPGSHNLHYQHPLDMSSLVSGSFASGNTLRLLLRRRQNCFAENRLRGKQLEHIRARERYLTASYLLGGMRISGIRLHVHAHIIESEHYAAEKSVLVKTRKGAS